MEDQSGGVSRSGRMRKKSAKVIEMESLEYDAEFLGATGQRTPKTPASVIPKQKSPKVTTPVSSKLISLKPVVDFPITPLAVPVETKKGKKKMATPKQEKKKVETEENNLKVKFIFAPKTKKPPPPVLLEEAPIPVVLPPVVELKEETKETLEISLVPEPVIAEETVIKSDIKPKVERKDPKPKKEKRPSVSFEEMLAKADEAEVAARPAVVKQSKRPPKTVSTPKAVPVPIPATIQISKSVEVQRQPEQPAVPTSLLEEDNSIESALIIAESNLADIIQSGPSEDGKKSKKSKKKSRDKGDKEEKAEKKRLKKEKREREKQEKLEKKLKRKAEGESKEKKKRKEKDKEKKHRKKDKLDRVDLDMVVEESVPRFSEEAVVDFNSPFVPQPSANLSNSLYFTEKSVKKKARASKTKNPNRKPRPVTAYMLWCRDNRKQIVAETPNIDFATISRRLGEMWQNLPEKTKLQWRRTAKRVASKGSNLINTGKQKEAKEPKSKLLNKHSRLSHSEMNYAVDDGERVQAYHPEPNYSEDVPESPNSKDLFRVMGGTMPVDVGAHLKLLGDSLSIIGQRLREHEGQIAVSGSLSVLLDSALCALGPLLCLTNQLHESNGCPKETLVKILDDVAYIMPGL